MFEFGEKVRQLDHKRLLKPLLAAEQAMARMDERLRALPFRDSVIERLVYHEACAVSLLEGKLVPLEDLVQFEGGVLQRISYPELSACHGTFAILRHAWRAAPDKLLECVSPWRRPGERPHCRRSAKRIRLRSELARRSALALLKAAYAQQLNRSRRGFCVLRLDPPWITNDCAGTVRAEKFNGITPPRQKTRYLL
jgi:hypothetical protein